MNYELIKLKMINLTSLFEEMKHNEVKQKEPNNRKILLLLLHHY